MSPRYPAALQRMLWMRTASHASRFFECSLLLAERRRASHSIAPWCSLLIHRRASQPNRSESQQVAIVTRIRDRQEPLPWRAWTVRSGIFLAIASLVGTSVLHAQASARSVVVEPAVDSAEVGGIKLFAKITSDRNAGQTFGLTVWAVNTTADTVIFSFQCHSAVLDFIPASPSGSTEPFSWRPNLFVDANTGVTTSACVNFAFARLIAPGDTLSAPELGGMSPAHDQRLARIAPGSYQLMLRLHVGLGIAPRIWNGAPPISIPLGIASVR